MTQVFGSSTHPLNILLFRKFIRGEASAFFLHYLGSLTELTLYCPSIRASSWYNFWQSIHTSSWYQFCQYMMGIMCLAAS
ncbi:hypothetical protein MKW98_026252 [Papaver atlanticum]|uniref:Uncharacterized protein n=1 Tax=Papaver atlanticum TaxID=357466 RepID=A0AAD4XID4_9MAGN|nr:hypothetical protein MKW98_026252 [Papaver atlanticum]